MSALDAIYNQTITLFNRIPGIRGEPTIWIPTIIEGVHLVVEKSSSWDNRGGRSENNARLHIQYKTFGGKPFIRCKTTCGVNLYSEWYEPKAWRRLLDPGAGLTFSFGENNDFDFFAEGTIDEFPAPISDENFEHKGFYRYMKDNYDNVFAICSVSKHNLIPHFEITAR